jgi:dynactin complex subunit
VAFDRIDVDYVGIHLEAPRGRHAGTVGGITYFDAEAGAAEFVRASRLVPGAGGGPARVAE